MSESQAIPHGYCQCGCGQQTPIARRTRSNRGEHKGSPKPYVERHRNRSPLVAYEVDPDTGCWNWSKTVTTNGYGVVKRQGYRQLMAHRFVYESMHGKVADDLDIDHLCRNRRCVNPDHLEPVSRGENLRRGARGKMTMASIFALRFADATTTLSRGDLAEMFGVSGRSVTRYLGSQGRGRTLEQRRRAARTGPEHVLRPSRPRGAYPTI